MSKEEILSVLSNININSETALEAVSLYINYLYFVQSIKVFIGLLSVGALLLVLKTAIKVNDE